jgi:proteasome assembly chaperone (PAC2) family protein
MIAGWNQWADGGKVSSGLPQYLIDHARATKIGEIRTGRFYLFQIPGAHRAMRPVARVSEGHVEELRGRRNEFFYSSGGRERFLIFLGEEPHQNEDRYARAFLDAVEALGVKRIAAVAGIRRPAPYDKDRSILCTYSLREMRRELAKYAVRFTSYRGGASIGTYLAHRAEARGVEFFTFCAIVPSYHLRAGTPPGNRMTVKEDFRAWYDLMLRLNHMFDLGMDLSDLERRSNVLTSGFGAMIEALAEKIPGLGLREYMDKVNRAFTETPFVPLSEIWEEQLGQLLDEDI